MSVALESDSWMDFLSEFFASRLMLNASRRIFHASSRFHNVSRSRFMLFSIVNERVVSFAKAPWRFSNFFFFFLFVFSLKRIKWIESQVFCENLV